VDAARVTLEDGSIVLMPIYREDPEQEVGLSDVTVKFNDLLEHIEPVAKQARDKLKSVKPDGMKLTMHVGLALESGGLVAFLGGAKMDTALEISFSWGAVLE
jgi:hypothetical protein